jgi:hypothetical protein
LGPSALSRVLACPGSFALSQRPEVKALGGRRSVYAAKGTVAHRVAEGVLSGDAPVMGVTTQEGHDIDVDDQMVDAVRIYTELCETFIALSDWHVVEQRVSLDDYWLPDKPPVPVFGTTDFAGFMVGPGLLRVIDYKHGAGVYVKAEDNPQALAYAAGALLICPYKVSEVEITIVQPNAAGTKPIRTQRMPVVDLLMWVKETLIPGIERTQTEPDTYVVGPYCRWCPGAAFCPLLMAARETRAIEQFADHHMSPEDYAEGLEQAERAELWIKAFRDLCKGLIAETDMNIPGWDLVPTRPVRSWDDEAQVEFAAKGLGIASTDLHEIRLRSPAQLEKRLGPELFRHLAKHIQRVSSGTKLERTSIDGTP